MGTPIGVLRPAAGGGRQTEWWRRSISSQPGCTSAASSTTARPATTVCRAATGPQRSQASTGSVSAPANGIPVSGQQTRSPTAPVRQRAELAGPAQAGGGAARRDVEHVAGAHAGRTAPLVTQERARVLASSHSDAWSVEAEPSHPSPTGAPAARSSATGSHAAAADEHVRRRAVGDADAGCAESAISGRWGRCSAPPSCGPTASPRPRSARWCARPPNAFAANRSSSGSSARCVCSRTSRRSASSAVRRIRSGGDRERRARRQRDAHHRPPPRVVMARDQPLAVGEDLVVVLHHRVRRQAAVLLRKAHRAAGRMEADAEFLRRGDLGGDEVTATTGMDVEVIGRRRAAAEGQLGQPDPRRHVRRFLVEARPERVERGQPREQRRVDRWPVARA